MTDLTDKASEQAARLANEHDDPTYFDIVWGQFRKNRLAYWSMWLVVGLFSLAIYAPLIADNHPFTIVIEGERSFPWWHGLWDRNHFESTVDLLFNLLMVMGTPFTVVLLLLRRRWMTLPRTLRRNRISNAVTGFVVVFLATAALMQTSGGAFLRWLGIAALLTAVGVGVARAMNASRPPLIQQRRMRQVATLGVVAFLIGGFTLPEENNSLPVRDFRELAEADGSSAVFPLLNYSYRENFLIDRARGGGSAALPSSYHLLGTDTRGRDILVRMIYGTRISLTIGIVAVSIYLTIGIFFGSLAGFFGGWVDIVVMRGIEVMLSIPTFFLMLTIVSFIEERSLFHLMVLIGVTRWTGVARLVRGEFLRLRKLDFVQAAIALGMPQTQVIFKHVLPNALGPVLVSATFGVASAILLESTLSFLGLGDPTAPSWGELLSMGRSSGRVTMILVSGLAIFVTVSLLNLMGEGLRDALDPKLRK